MEIVTLTLTKHFLKNSVFLKNLEKVKHIFSNTIEPNLVISNPTMCVPAYFEYARTHVLVFLITKFSLIAFEEEKNMA